MALEVDIIVPSHLRADRVTTNKHIDNVKICVPDSQYKDYVKHNPNTEIIAHPDSIIGLTPKRQWIMEQFPNCFQVDDDMTQMRRLYTEKGEEVKLWSEEAYEVIQWTANVCKLMGSHYFGFNPFASPTGYHELHPFRLTGYILGGGFGILEGSKLYFDEDQKLVEDYWVSGLNAYHHRKCFVDSRFSLVFTDTFANQGGCSSYRTMEQEKIDTLWLRKMFGESIQLKKDTGLAKRKHPYQRTLKLPF
tara:strand:- start:2370 stop:3113 length:744 start_codon:yes stop_codon:yes gene_type:complete